MYVIITKQYLNYSFVLGTLHIPPAVNSKVKWCRLTTQIQCGFPLDMQGIKEQTGCCCCNQVSFLFYRCNNFVCFCQKNLVGHFTFLVSAETIKNALPFVRYERKENKNNYSGDLNSGLFRFSNVQN